MARTDEWIDGLAEGVVLVEGDRVVRLNAAAGEILGAPPDWAVGKRLISVLRDHRLERVYSQAQRAEVTLAGRTVQAVPLPGGLALRDVSEARRANESASSLLAVLSHELRTPLTTVRATLDALGYEELSAQERSRLLTRAIDEADRLVRLLGDLTSDVTPPRERSVSLSDTVERAGQILTATLSERSVRLRHDLGGTTAWADPDKLLQVLLNLIENAALHGPHEAEIEIAAKEREGWVVVVVRDEGEALREAPIGLPSEPAPHPPSKEHGLGLFIVRSIVEGWGGRAWWQPRAPDERTGNEFVVTVPGSREAARLRAEGLSL